VSDASKPGKPHTLADHAYGADALHVHDDDGDYDHDHDDPGADQSIEDNPIWLQDNLQLTSVGIDIGSAGTQVVFSRLTLRRHGEDLTSRYHVVARETVHRSPVALTPYQSETRIDARALAGIIDAAYAAAALHPDDIDSGVVILTGEALRRDNARGIGEVLADQGGEFVCATAGHHMEAMLAAYGSGAAKAAYERAARVLNIDVGGATTKLALIERGKVLATAALHLGGRLLVTDAHGRIVRLDPAGRYLAAQAGFDWSPGDRAGEADVARVVDWMADALVRALTTRAAPAPIETLWLTDPLSDLRAIDGVMFSGGVAEYVYGRESRGFGDWGQAFGAALRARADDGRLPWPLWPAGECIRATALGASEYSVQLSGNTTYISDPGALLPRRNLQVLRPDLRLEETVDPAAVTHAVRAHFTQFDGVEGEADIALAFRWRGAPAYARLAAFARGVVDALPGTLAATRPLYLIVDGDVAQTLGHLLKSELGVRSEVLVIDGVTLWDFDYIDLGRIRLPSNTVPVTIKSLVFGADPRTPRYRNAHLHRHGFHVHAHADARDHDH
jgi:ethanolamine utilization protein EutA